MTDLEMTKLCARAISKDALEIERSLFLYNPLHDDAQAMALVKKFNIRLQEPLERGQESFWTVWIYGTGGSKAKNADLNRAIVECVAKMEAAK